MSFVFIKSVKRFICSTFSLGVHLWEGLGNAKDIHQTIASTRIHIICHRNELLGRFAYRGGYGGCMVKDSSHVGVSHIDV